MVSTSKAIILSRKVFSSYQTSSPFDDTFLLDHLSRINIFVGANNSGKSQLIRKIYSLRTDEKEFIPTEIDRESYQRFHESLSQEFNRITSGGLYIKYVAEMRSKIGRCGSPTYEGIKTLISNLSSLIRVESSEIGSRLADALNNLGRNYSERIWDLVHSPSISARQHVYIPTLRGLRPFGEKDYYHDRTVKDYFGSSDNRYEVFTGLGLYEKVKELLLGNLEKREIISNFQDFLSENFFDGQKVALIPAYKSDVLNVKIGDEMERPIYGLGDGIQSIIIMTFPLFYNRGKKTLVFIEEPELYMHPGLQRKLIEAFMQFDEYQYFITTHSNHFLDITLDIDQVSIYSLHKRIDDEEQNKKERIPTFMIENVSNEDNSVLEMLGVKNSSVFLSNCTIWVEGITDRYYLRHYLDVYQDHLLEQKVITKKYKEDYHFSFVEYSGNNITHWSFLDEDIMGQGSAFGSMNVDRLCSKLFLISDKDSEKKLPRQQKLAEKLGDRFYCLSCKEIENLLKKDVLLQVIAEYERVDANKLQFTKNFSESTYQNKYLGRFIQDYLTNKQRRGDYASPSGTINDKVNFCKKAIRHIKTIQDMSEETVRLCESLFEFIKHNNG